MVVGKLGKLIDQLYDQRAARIALGKQVDDMKVKEAELRHAIIKLLKDGKMSKGGGQRASATITKAATPIVEDWDKLYAYIHKNKAFHLLHQRIASRAWGEMIEAKKVVPGVSSMVVEDLSVTKLTHGGQ